MRAETLERVWKMKQAKLFLTLALGGLFFSARRNPRRQSRKPLPVPRKPCKPW